MGFISQFILGSAVGFVFIYSMDNFYYVTLRRNVGQPASEELNKDKIDLNQLSKTVTRGLGQTYRELWP